MKRALNALPRCGSLPEIYSIGVSVWDPIFAQREHVGACWEVVHIIRGVVKLRMQGASFRGTSGDTLLIPSQTPHCDEFPLGAAFEVLHIMFTWQDAPALFQPQVNGDLVRLPAADKLGKIFYAEGEYLHEIINLLVNAKTGKCYWRHERPPIWYCAHTLGPLLMLMKDRIVKACGLTTGFNKLPQFKKHIGFLDFEIGLFKTQKGAVIKILRSQVVARPPMVWYSIFGTKGHLENGRLSEEGLTFIEKEMDKHHPKTIPTPIVDPNAPEEAKKGGHGTSEYYMIRDFLKAVESGARPPIDAVKAADMTIPGLIAHESAMKGGQWMDVPLMNW